MQVMKSGMTMRCAPSLTGCTSASKYQRHANLPGRCTKRQCTSLKAESDKLFLGFTTGTCFILLYYYTSFLLFIKNSAHIALILRANFLMSLLTCLSVPLINEQAIEDT